MGMGGTLPSLHEPDRLYVGGVRHGRRRADGRDRFKAAIAYRDGGRWYVDWYRYERWGVHPVAIFQGKRHADERPPEQLRR